MLDWLHNRSGIDKSSEDYSKLRAALEQSVKHPKRTEANYDYEGMASLIDLSVNKKQNIKFNPKLTAYNSALLQIQKSAESQTVSSADVRLLKSTLKVSLKQHPM
jgi:hypothetical protein